VLTAATMIAACGRLPPECAFGERARGHQLLSQARDQLSHGEASQAVTSAHTGIGVLADNYADKRIIDDTEVLLGLAADAERRGRQDEAAKVLITALEKRLGIYDWKCMPAATRPKRH
jgi:hypothetical protein